MQQALEISPLLLINPVTGLPFEFNRALSACPLRKLREPTATVLCFEGQVTGGRRFVIFADGHGELISADAWQRLRKQGAFPVPTAEEQVVGAMSPKEAAKVRAQQATSLENLKKLCWAMRYYMQNFTCFVMPATERWEEELVDVGIDSKILIVPGTGMHYQFNASLAKKTLAQIPSPETAIMFYEPISWADGTRNAAFVDGHVERLTPEQWAAAARKSGTVPYALPTARGRGECRGPDVVGRRDA